MGSRRRRRIRAGSVAGGVAVSRRPGNHFRLRRVFALAAAAIFGLVLAGAGGAAVASTAATAVAPGTAEADAAGSAISAADCAALAGSLRLPDVMVDFAQADTSGKFTVPPGQQGAGRREVRFHRPGQKRRRSVGGRLDARLRENPQAVELADGLDDPGQHQVPEYVVPARGRASGAPQPPAAGPRPSAPPARPRRAPI
jgi:hypothetical protein